MVASRAYLTDLVLNGFAGLVESSLLDLLGTCYVFVNGEVGVVILFSSLLLFLFLGRFAFLSRSLLLLGRGGCEDGSGLVHSVASKTEQSLGDFARITSGSITHITSHQRFRCRSNKKASCQQPRCAFLLGFSRGIVILGLLLLDCREVVIKLRFGHTLPQRGKGLAKLVIGADPVFIGGHCIEVRHLGLDDDRLGARGQQEGNGLGDFIPSNFDERWTLCLLGLTATFLSLGADLFDWRLFNCRQLSILQAQFEADGRIGRRPIVFLAIGLILTFIGIRGHWLRELRPMLFCPVPPGLLIGLVFRRGNISLQLRRKDIGNDITNCGANSGLAPADDRHWSGVAFQRGTWGVRIFTVGIFSAR